MGEKIAFEWREAIAYAAEAHFCRFTLQKDNGVFPRDVRDSVALGKTLELYFQVRPGGGPFIVNQHNSVIPLPIFYRISQLRQIVYKWPVLPRSWRTEGRIL